MTYILRIGPLLVAALLASVLFWDASARAQEVDAAACTPGELVMLVQGEDMREYTDYLSFDPTADSDQIQQVFLDAGRTNSGLGSVRFGRGATNYRDGVYRNIPVDTCPIHSVYVWVKVDSGSTLLQCRVDHERDGQWDYSESWGVIEGSPDLNNGFVRITVTPDVDGQIEGGDRIGINKYDFFGEDVMWVDYWRAVA